MLSITYFCREISSPGSDSSMHASLRVSERLEEEQAWKERLALWCRRVEPPSPSPWGSGHPSQSGAEVK